MTTFTDTVTVKDWDCGSSLLSEKIYEIFSVYDVHGEWILQEYEEIKGRYSPGEDIQTVVKSGFTLQRFSSSTIEIFCDGAITTGKLTSCGDSVTVTRSNCHQLDVLRSLLSAWD